MQKLRTELGTARHILGWMACVATLFLGSVRADAQSTYEFSIPTLTTFEGDPPAGTNLTVVVVRSGDISTMGSVDYFTSESMPVSAIQGGDYSAAAGTLVFLPGELFQTFDIQIIGDATPENDETFSITLDNPVGGTLGLINAGQVIIYDDDACFSFAATVFRTNEDAGTILVTINRELPAGGASSVQLVIRDGTTNFPGVVISPPAVSPMDFIAFSTNLVFTNGQTSFTVAIPFIDDCAIETNSLVTNMPLFARVENILMSLTNAIGGKICPAPSDTALIHIVDTDTPAGQFAFTIAGPYFAMEDEPRPPFLRVFVSRLCGTNGAVSVDVEMFNDVPFSPPNLCNGFLGGAYWSGPRNDYTFTGERVFPNGIPGTTLNWADGDGNDKFIQFQMINDTRVELDEVINMRLVRAMGGATIVAARRFNDFFIGNDDAPAGTADTFHNTLGILNPTPGANNTVYASVTYTDGSERTLVGGDFTAFNAVVRNGVARILPSGAVDTTFDPGSGADGFVSSLVLQPDGRILVAGGFTSFDNLSRYGIARLNANGSLDGTFDVGAGANGPVQAIALQPDGKVIIGGEFTTFNNVPRVRLARLNSDGSLDLSFEPGAGADATVYALAMQANGMVLAGGAFQQIGGQFFNSVARLTTNGTVDPGWQPVAGADGPVYALKVQLDGRALIGGAFRSYDGDMASGLARLQTNGLLDPTFNVCRGIDGVVYAITPLINGGMYVGGDFTVFNDTPRANVVRLLANGSIDTLFLDSFYNHTAPGLDTFVAAISVQLNGDVLVGGGFSVVGGGWAILLPPLTRYVPTEFMEIRFNFARLLGNITDPLRFTAGLPSTENAPGNLQLVQPTYSIDENVLGGLLAITAERINGGLGAVSVNFRTVDGSAKAGVDYIAVAGTLPWDDCSQGLQLIGVPILDNQVVEGNKNFFIELSMPASFPFPGVNQPALGFNCRAEVTIVDNDVNRGVFGFSQPIFTFSEKVGTATITVTRTNGSSGRATVQYQTVPGSAVGPGDYTAVTGTLTFESGDTVKTFNIPIADDILNEFEETFSVRLHTPTGGATLGLTNSTVILLSDENGRGSISFTATDYTVSESAGSLTLNLRRTSGSLSNVTVLAFSADLPPGPGSAREGVDYIGFTNTVAFTNGQTNVVLTIPILSDRFVEGPERFTLGVTNVAGGATIGFISRATVHITDDDAYGQLTFVSANYYAPEEGGVALLNVIRTGGDAEEVTVDYQVVAGTATDGLDFLGVAGTLTFPDGVTSQSIAVPILDDPDLEGPETVLLSLDNAVKAGAGPITNATLTINDDESQAVPAGGIDTSFNPQPGPNGFVNVVALQPDGQILIGGQFTAFGGTGRRRIARLNTDGSVDLTFNPGQGADADVNAVVVQPDGKILLGGEFTTMGNRNRGHVARVTSSGVLDTSFNPGSGADNPVHALALQPDGKVIIGGDFASFNGITRNGIARLSANGVNDPTFNPGTGASGTVFALALLADGKILVGGEFATYNNQNTPRLVRLNPDGSVDPTFNTSAPINGAVRAIAVQPDGRIVIGGAFTAIGATSRPFLARLEADGSLDATFNPGAGANSLVYSIAVQPDGKLVVGGEFTSFGGLLNNRIVRLRPNGTLDSSINFGAGANQFIASIALQTDGAILIGGGFTAFAGVPRPYVARLVGGEDITPGVLQFIQPGYAVLENGTNVAITIARVGGSQGQVEVDLMSVDLGSASAGVDYGFVSQHLVFADGEAIKTVVIGITNDAVVEPDEVFQLSLTNVAGGATLNEAAVTIVTIVNDDSSVGFSLPAFNVNEAVVGGNAVIDVRRLGATNDTVTVNYATVPGVATNGQDYSSVSGQLTFLPGQTNQSFTIPILDDFLVEGNEPFSVILSNLTGGAIFSFPAATVNIIDDDFSPGSLAFSQPSYTVNESNGTITITIVRTNGTTGVVTADWSTRSGTAVGGSDYIAPGGSVSLADGQASASFVITINDDAAVEGNETFEVLLSNPTGGSILIPPTVVVVNIEDNEFGPGTLDPTFNPGTGANDLVYSVAVAPNGQVIAGGAFTLFNGADRARVVRLHADGSVDLGFYPGVGPNFIVNSVGTYTNGKVAIGGAFTLVNGQPLNRVARLDTNGLPDPSLTATNNGLNSAVNVVLTTPAGGVVVGGGFVLPTPGVARFRTDGTQDTTFDPGSSIDGAVHALAHAPEGGLFIAGAFTNVNGFRRWKVARLQNDGLLDPGFNPPAISNGVIFALASQPDGKVIIAGSFTNVGNTARRRIARLNVNGSLDFTFNPGPGADGTIRALALQPDGRVLAAGDFLNLGGTNRSRIGRLNTDGTIDLSFDPGRGADSTIFSIALSPDGRAIIGGAFTMVNGFPRQGVARLNSDARPPRFAEISLQFGAAVLRLISSPGAVYALEGSTDLIGWTALSTNNSGGFETILTDTANFGLSNRFYRVRQVSP